MIKRLLFITLFQVVMLWCFAQNTQPKLVVQTSHYSAYDSEIYGGVFSPDSKYMLTYDRNGLYIIWEIKGGREVQRFMAQTPPSTPYSKRQRIPFYSKPSLSPDNKYCLTEGTDKNSFTLWNVTTGKEVYSFSPSRTDELWCNQAVFSSDGNYAIGNVMFKGGNKMVFYEIATGRKEEILIKGTFRTDGKGEWGEFFKQPYSMPSCITVSPDMKKLAIGMLDGRMMHAEIQALKKKSGKAELTMNDMDNVFVDTLPVTNISFSDDNKTLIAKTDNLVYLWDIARKKNAGRIPIPTHESVNFRYQVETLKYTLKEEDKKESYISDDGKLLVVLEQNSEKAVPKLNFINVKNSKILFSIVGYSGENYSGDVRKTGEFIGAGLDDIIISNNGKYYANMELLANTQTGKIEQTFTPNAVALTNAGFFQQGKKMFFGNPASNAMIFDFTTGEYSKLRNFTAEADTLSGGKYLYKNNEYEYTYNTCISPDEKIAISGNQLPPLGSGQPVFSIYNLENHQLIRSVYAPVPLNIPFPVMYSQISNDNKYALVNNYLYNMGSNKLTELNTEFLYFSKDGKSIIGVEEKKINNKAHFYLTQINPLTLKKVPLVELRFTKNFVSQRYDSLFKRMVEHVLIVIPFQNKLAVNMDGDMAIMNLENGAELFRFKGTAYNISSNGRFAAGVDAAGKEILLYDLTKKGEIAFKLTGHSSRVSAIQISSDSKRLVSVSKDRTAIIWDIETGKQLALFVAYSDNDFILRTSDGYYMGTKKGIQAMHFSKDLKSYLFNQFDLQYNRPDKVLENLGMASPAVVTAYKNAYEKRLKKMNFNPASFEKEITFNVPEVAVNIPENITTTSDPQFKLKVHATDKLYNLNRLNILVNGVPVLGKNGYDLKKQAAKEASVSFTLELSYGKNTIEITAMNEKGITSLAERIETEYTGSFKKADLYIVAIGAGKYTTPDQNLTYASKDATDMIELFSKNTNYSQVHKILLTNENVNPENILKIKDQLLLSKPNDQVIIFYAGHGVVDDQMDFYFGTYNINFLNPSNGGLQYDELENLMDNIPARNKIFFIDACNSGEIDKEEMIAGNNKNAVKKDVTFRSVGNKTINQKHVGLDNSFELMRRLFNDLRQSTGASVLSAASGIEAALEGTTWKNGVFTYCLLSGIKDKKADLNKDGKIMLSELQRYVEAGVSELTQGKQTPVSRTENLVKDFQIW